MRKAEESRDENERGRFRPKVRKGLAHVAEEWDDECWGPSYEYEGEFGVETYYGKMGRGKAEKANESRKQTENSCHMVKVMKTRKLIKAEENPSFLKEMERENLRKRKCSRCAASQRRSKTA